MKYKKGVSIFLSELCSFVDICKKSVMNIS